MLWSCLVCLALLPGTSAAGGPAAQPEPPPKKIPEKSVEELANSVRASLVVIKYTPRAGQPQGLGTGFVVSADGLIATNLHVIGEARPVTIQLENGKEYPVTAVHASDRALDLALLRIDVNKLQALPLGDSDRLKNGQAVVALGHPRGLRNSVVAGVLSGRPTIDGQAMLQLAIPIEQGNSGGPVLDRHGKVQGIVTLKSQVTANLGFAVPINALKKLLQRPNPIPIARWVTIGRLNPDEWKVVFAGNWRQRNGVIIAGGSGEGFGGRSLCLAQAPPPAVPYEVAVTVRLKDESGAGGLIFHADGGDRHYGFYPSAGKLRLSRFDGPDVFTWKVLYNEASKDYHLGEWNTFKVRIEKDRMLCYVNDHLVLESKDTGLTGGKVGLAKFRNTHVEFKNFRMGANLAAAQPSAELVAKITQLVAKLPSRGKGQAKLVKSLMADGPAGIKALRDQARLLEEQAAQLRQLAQAVHQKKILDELVQVTASKDSDMNLVRAALLLARLDNEELDIDGYLRQIDRLAQEIRDALPKDADEETKFKVLNRELFEQRGFHGSRSDYYNRANSYLHLVLEDREGLPITLSIVYMELAGRLGLKIEGVGLPGHFVVRHVPQQGQLYLIDVFEGGKKLSQEEASKKVRAYTGKPLRKEYLAPVSKKAILVRMLHNLIGIAREEQDAVGVVRYLDALLVIAPEAVEERLLRAAGRFQLGDRDGALDDLDWLLKNAPPGVDRDKVLQLRQLLERK
jgi:regulator of sirC expression with transglutaminase-like and TPR domain